MAGITPDGTYKQKKIPYLLSDSHITEILDLVCDNRYHSSHLISPSPFHELQLLALHTLVALPSHL